MRFRTEVEIEVSKHPIVYEEKLLALGSCFAEQIGQQCKNYLYQITTNPFGVLYNPLSIASCIQTLVNEDVNGIPYVLHNGLYSSLYHHSSFSGTQERAFVENIEKSVAQGHQAIVEADVVIVTFGTAWVYYLEDFSLLFNRERFSENLVVANCHKLPERSFSRRCASVEGIVSVWQTIIDFFPKKHWIFTVSPIRHVRDGLHANQLSKSTLLLAVDQLVKKNAHLKVDYFPAYEIILDELRDYRFFAEDMLHPSQQAMDYVWEKFIKTFLHTTMPSELQQMKKLHLSLEHRPNVSLPNVEQDKFQEVTKQLYESLLPAHPWIAGEAKRLEKIMPLPDTNKTTMKTVKKVESGSIGIDRFKEVTEQLEGTLKVLPWLKK